MTNRNTGRHRAPSRLTEAGTTISRSAKTTAVVATSGGLLASAIGPATASPQGVVDEVASVVSQVVVQSTVPSTNIDLLGLTMPVMAEPTDLPAVAVPAPQDVDIEFGALGFTGVTPVVEEPEPVVEEPAAQEPVAEPESAAEAAPQTTSSTEERTESSSSRTNEREAAPAPAPEPEPEPAPAPAPPSNGGGVLGIAAAYTGIPYVYGGGTPAGFDCSGYTSFVFRQVGVNLPRSAAAQQSYATPVSNPQPGDLVFFGYPAYHVGIYAGNGMMYDAGRPGIPTQLRGVFSGVSGYGRVL